MVFKVLLFNWIHFQNLSWSTWILQPQVLGIQLTLITLKLPRTSMWNFLQSSSAPFSTSFLSLTSKLRFWSAGGCADDIGLKAGALKRFVIRWWRDIGEQPCVWSNFGLRFIGCDVDHLLEVLSLGRLQGLQQLHWIPCVQFDPDLPILDIIAENHTGI